MSLGSAGRAEDCTTRTVTSAVSGYAVGAVLGAITTNWGDVPVVLRDKPFPALARTGAVMAQHGTTFGIVGLMYSGVECFAESVRGKADWKNGALGGIAAGGALGLRIGRLPVGVAAAAAFAAASALTDASGQRLKGSGVFDDGATPPRRIFPHLPANPEA